MTRDELIRVCFREPVVSSDESLEARHGDDVIGHVGLYWRTLLVGDRELPVGGVGAVCTDPDWRTYGIARFLLALADEAILKAGLQYAALFAGKREWRDLYDEAGYVLYEEEGWPPNLAVSPLVGTAHGAPPLHGLPIAEPPERW